jgi:DNA-binding beta-propeller fold protein YncE
MNHFSRLVLALLLLAPSAFADHRMLYVAVPGIRNDPKVGGTGILVFDIDHDHKFLRRIPVPALGDVANPIAAKGICASAVTGRLYVSTPKDMTCLDLVTEKVVWTKAYNAGCDRMSIAPDGKTIYLPTFEGPYWHVVDAMTGEEIAKITPNSGAHNTVWGPDGKHVFLAGLKSPLLTVADASTNAASATVGPFANSIRPFTVDSKSARVYVCVNELLGFEIGDLATGQKLARVEVTGESKGPVRRHGCPSHGIALSPDEKELWLCDGHNQKLHVFDNTAMPPSQIASIPLRDQPGWVTFTRDGQYAYPSTGEVIDPKTKKILLALQDETGAPVHSEKLMEIDVDPSGKPTQTADQFGVGRR